MLADMNGNARTTDAGADIQGDRRAGTVHRSVLYSMHEEASCASCASCAGSGLPANPVLCRRSQPHTRRPSTADLLLRPSISIQAHDGCSIADCRGVDKEGE